LVINIHQLNELTINITNEIRNQNLLSPTITSTFLPAMHVDSFAKTINRHIYQLSALLNYPDSKNRYQILFSSILLFANIISP